MLTGQQACSPHLCPPASSLEKLLILDFEQLEVGVVLQLLQQTSGIHDRLMSLVEQLFTELLLQSVSPGAQLWPAFKHIRASSNRLQDPTQLCAYKKGNSG